MHRFPYLVAWTNILGEPHNWKSRDLELLEFLFSDRSGLAYFHFSELHRACLGLSAKLLRDVITCTGRSSIDAVDNMGRTTLSWAAQRGDSDAVKLLLMRGADPERPDHSLTTPLHWSAAAQSDACMLLLLQRGAEVNTKDVSGRTAFSHVASKGKDASFMKTLIMHGADIETQDDEGWRPIHWAAHEDQPAFLNILLENQAESNAVDKLGRGPLQLAMLRNRHQAMQVLVDRDACGGNGKTALGSTILHSAADNADIEALQILESANLGNVPIMVENLDGFTAQRIAVNRRDNNGEWANSSCQTSDPDPLAWYEAFERFMGSVIRKSQALECGNLRRDQKAWSDISSDWVAVNDFDDSEDWKDAVPKTKDKQSLAIVLPRGLAITPVPKLSVTDRVKEYVEDFTQVSWDWWPLKPCHRAVEPGLVRIKWNCVGADQSSVRDLLN